MGLDMYLFRVKKLQQHGIVNVKDYTSLDDNLRNLDANSPGGDKDKLFKIPSIEKVDVLTRTIGSDYRYYTIFEEIGYWRKANQIHAWFVKNAQDGIDECQYAQVRLGDLRALLILVYQVLDDHSKAKELLPVQEGFFFGSSEYDKWYFENLVDAKKILEKALTTTNWDDQAVFYHSSW